LANVNRSADLTAFLRGVRILQDEGVPVKVDTILGLPGDSLATFENTMHFIADMSLDPVLFHLSLSHGTKLRREIGNFGAQVQLTPPFYVLETNTFTAQDLETAANKYIEISADFDKTINLHLASFLSNPSFANSTLNSSDDLHFNSGPYPLRNIVLVFNEKANPGKLRQAAELSEKISHRVSNELSIQCIGNSYSLLSSLWLLKVIITEISANNPFITWSIHLQTGNVDHSQAVAEELRSCLRRGKTFLDYRDVLIRRDLPHVRRRSVNILTYVPCAYNSQTALSSQTCCCIRTATITGQEPIGNQIKMLTETVGNGFLLDFESGSDIDFVRGFMADLRAIDKQVFFQDWVLQRVWESDYLRITPERYNHYELLVDQDLRLSAKFFDESELFWDAIVRWKMTRPEYSDVDIEKIVSERILSSYSNIKAIR
jgi:hypothetical protein